MGKKSNGKLRAQRHFERAVRKGVDPLAPAQTDGYAYVVASDGTSLFSRQRG